MKEKSKVAPRFISDISDIMWSLRLPVAVLVVTELAGLISCSDSASQTETERRDNSFDIYIFTLHWPYTTCLDWRESGHGHKCNKIGEI